MPHRRYLPSEMAALAAILFLAAVFRYWQIAEYPKALHFDEALNGLVAQDLLRGRLPHLLTYGDAREPMIYYLMAAPAALFGPTPGALRVATATISLALVGGVFLLGRELFGRRTALLAALLCAATVWAAYHGRLATRSILVPVVLSAALYSGARSWRGRRVWPWALTGLLFGAVFYTYATNLFVVPFVVLMALGLFAFDRRACVERKWRILLAATCFVVVGLPIIVYRAAHAGVGFDRPQEVSMFYAGQSAGDFARAAVAQTFLVARMFVARGDLNIRHNIPGRPVFDVLMAAPLVIGLAAAWGRQTRRAAALCALGLGVWLMPSLMTKDAPHFLRASGALAFLFVWPALGLAWLRDVLKQRIGGAAALLLASAILGGSIIITARDYIFSGFLATPEIAQEYFGENTAPILEFNQKYHTGWVGDNLRALPEPAGPIPSEELERARNFPQPYAQYLIPWLFDPGLEQY